MLVDAWMGESDMSKTFTAVVKEDCGVWIGWIEEVPGVNCQEDTREALLESLRITLAEAIQLNRDEALGAAGNDYEEMPIAV
jgi:predicted RNase H-like HicB family nuclease